MTVKELRALVALMPPEWDDFEVVRDSCTQGYDGKLRLLSYEGLPGLVELQ